MVLVALVKRITPVLSGEFLLSEAIRHVYSLEVQPHEVVSANPRSIRGAAASWAKIARASALGNLSCGYTGRPCVPLPNIIIWTLLGSLLAPTI